MGADRKPLNLIRVETPCPKRWQDMEGDDKLRYCDACRRYVHNVSAMSTDEASALVSGTQGRICVRYLAAPDGTPVTRDSRHRAPRLLAVVLGVLTSIFAPPSTWPDWASRAGDWASSVFSTETTGDVVVGKVPSPGMGESGEDSPDKTVKG
jgi:hypothetical protein